MVSSLTSLLRPRREDRASKQKKSASAPVLQKVASSEDEKMSSTTTVQEVVIEKADEVDVLPINNGTIVVASTETKDSNGTPALATLEIHVENKSGDEMATSSFSIPIPDVKGAYLKTRQYAVDRIDDVRQYFEGLPDDYQNAIRYAGLMVASLLLFFWTIVIFRYLKVVFLPQQQGWFCWMFANPFSPLFNALCHEPPHSALTDIPNEAALLAGEVGDGVSHVLNETYNGFAAFGAIFSAILSGINRNLSLGLHELGENMGENVSHLGHFILQFFYFIVHVISSAIACLAGSVAGAANAVHEYFADEPKGWF